MRRATPSQAITVLLLAACSAATPLTADSCAWEHIHHGGAAPQDLGQGLTFSRTDWGGYHNPSGPWAGMDALITDCAQGLQLVMTEFVQEEPPGPRLDKRADVLGVTDALRAASEPTSLDQVAEAAATRGIPARRAQPVAETCGCAVFYPELRGDKQPYEAPV